MMWSTKRSTVSFCSRKVKQESKNTRTNKYIIFCVYNRCRLARFVHSHYLKSRTHDWRVYTQILARSPKRSLTLYFSHFMYFCMQNGIRIYALWLCVYVGLIKCAHEWNNACWSSIFCTIDWERERESEFHIIYQYINAVVVFFSLHIVHKFIYL